MDRFFSYDGESRDTHETAEDARNKCAVAIGHYRDNARDDEGWSDEVEGVFWGEIRERSEAVPDEDVDDPEERGYDYRLAPVVASAFGDLTPTVIVNGCEDCHGMTVAVSDKWACLDCGRHGGVSS